MSQRTTDISLFEFKSIGLNVLAFQPVTLNSVQLEKALGEKLGAHSHFLSGSQLALDFDALPEIPSAMDIAALMQLLRQFDLHLIASKGGNALQQQAARDAGLFALCEESNALPAAARASAEAVPAMIITRAVRTGQQVYARGGDLIVTGLVSSGAELIADGNIHVYAPLRGRALAGARGNTQARIFTTCMEAELVSIAGIYRTLDDQLPASIRRLPAQVYLDQDKLITEALRGIS